MRPKKNKLNRFIFLRVLPRKFYLNMEIVKYNKKSGQDYLNFVKKHNKVKEFNTLNKNNFNDESKQIYLVIGLNILKKPAILAYAIIYEDLKNIYLINKISSDYPNDGSVIFLSDFMVKKSKRNKGIGKNLANYLINEIYKDKNIILQPTEDGYWFWKKYGFIDDKISECMTWVLKNDNFLSSVMNQ